MGRIAAVCCSDTVKVAFPLHEVYGTQAVVEHSDADAYQLIVRETPTAIALLDLDGLVIEVNPATERLLGYRRGEILGEPCERFTHPDDNAAELPLLQALLRGERKEYEIEKRYVRKNGFNVWSWPRLRLVRDDAGAPSYLLAVIEDLTERRRAEEEQRVLTEQLRQAQKLEAEKLVRREPAVVVVARELEAVGERRAGVLLLVEIPERVLRLNHEPVVQSEGVPCFICRDEALVQLLAGANAGHEDLAAGRRR